MLTPTIARLGQISWMTVDLAENPAELLLTARGDDQVFIISSLSLYLRLLSSSTMMLYIPALKAVLPFNFTRTQGTQTGIGDSTTHSCLSSFFFTFVTASSIDRLCLSHTGFYAIFLQNPNHPNLISLFLF